MDSLRRVHFALGLTSIYPADDRSSPNLMTRMWHGHGADLTALTGHVTIASQMAYGANRKEAYMHGGDSGGFPGPLFIFSRQRPRRPYTQSDLRIVALIVGLGAVAALLWLAIALH
jgi:hypothetical protein